MVSAECKVFIHIIPQVLFFSSILQISQQSICLLNHHCEVSRGFSQMAKCLQLIENLAKCMNKSTYSLKSELLTFANAFFIYHSVPPSNKETNKQAKPTDLISFIVWRKTPPDNTIKIMLLPAIVDISKFKLFYRSLIITIQTVIVLDAASPRCRVLPQSIKLSRSHLSHSLNLPVNS